MTSSEDVEAIVNNLLMDFMSHYRKFDGSCLKNVVEGRTVMLLFGTSKAGKSTLMARLRSGDNCADFLEKLPKEGRATIEGIDVSTEINSCTIEPSVFNVDGIPICDTPGLKDTNQVNKAIISILHKCLFRRLPQAKMLIIIDIKKLAFARTGVVDEYVTPLIELFGVNFSKCLQNCFFVLTHGDCVPDACAVVEECRKIVEQLLAADNVAASQFFLRIVMYHFIVDYAGQTRQQLIDKVRQWSETNGFMVPQNFVHDKLYADANDVNRMCDDLLKKRINEERNNKALLQPLIAKTRDFRDDYVRDKLTVDSKIVELEISIRKEKVDESEMQCKIDRLDEQIVACQGSIKSAEDIVTTATLNVQQSDKVLTASDATEVIKLESVPGLSPGVMRRTVHSVNVTVKKVNKSENSVYGVIVSTLPEVTKDVCDQLYRTDSINMLSSYDAKNQFIQYNSVISLNKLGNDCSIVSRIDGFVVNVRMNNPFEIVLAYPMKLSESPALCRFREFQHRKLVIAQNDLLDLRKKQTKLINEKHEKCNEMALLSAAIAKYEEDLARKKNVLIEKAETYNNNLAQIRRELIVKYEKLKLVSTRNDTVINNMNLLTDILKENALAYNMIDSMNQYVSLVSTNDAEIVQAVKNVDSLIVNPVTESSGESSLQSKPIERSTPVPAEPIFDEAHINLEFVPKVDRYGALPYIKAGKLMKQGVDHYFVLARGRLFEYSSPLKYETGLFLESFDLVDCQLRSDMSNLCEFEVYNFGVGSSFTLLAKTDAICQDWKQAISKHIEFANVHDTTPFHKYRTL